MKPKVSRRAVVKAPEPQDGQTRPPGAPLNEGSDESYRDVQPAGFKDHPSSSIEAAVVDPDVDDSEGGE